MSGITGGKRHNRIGNKQWRLSLREVEVARVFYTAFEEDLLGCC